MTGVVTGGMTGVVTGVVTRVLTGVLTGNITSMNNFLFIIFTTMTTQEQLYNIY